MGCTTPDSQAKSNSLTILRIWSYISVRYDDEKLSIQKLQKDKGGKALASTNQATSLFGAYGKRTQE